MVDVPDLAAPGTPRRPTNKFEWYLRLSGLALVLLVLGHVFITTVLDNGVQRVNFAFVAGRWSALFWRLWDLLMLWLAEIHGTVGLRTVIEDYARRDATRRWLTVLLYTSAVLILALGTFVIVTFDPNLNAG